MCELKIGRTQSFRIGDQEEPPIPLVTMTMKSMKYSDCDTIMDGYNPVPPPLPRRVPPVRNIYAEPFATDTSTSSRYRTQLLRKGLPM